MKSIEACRKAVEHGTMLIRSRNAEHNDLDVMAWHESIPEGNGWTLLDQFSASICVAIYDALCEEKQKDMDRKPFLVFHALCLKLHTKVFGG